MRGLSWSCCLAVALASPNAAESQARRESQLPVPNGEYSVGRTTFEWTDVARADPENPGGHRQLVVWLWYPAAPWGGAEAAEWMPAAWGEAFWADFAKAHPDVADGLASHPSAAIRTHARTDSPPAPGPAAYPVVLFAPGLGTTPLEYASLVEDVVSHGYIVAGIVPTYVAAATVFDDGRVVKGRDPMAPLTARGRSRPTTEQAMRRYEELATLVSNDLSFGLTQLAKVNADERSPLKGRFDLARVGALGHSLGGAAVVQLAVDDARVRATFDIDGSPIWRTTNPAIGKPVLVLSAAATNVGYDNVLRGAEPGRHLRLAGSSHTFASDLRLMPFQPEQVRHPAPGSGAIQPARALAITAAYVEAFFDQYLKGRAGALLSGPSRDYPEITFER
jgi:dienelactone hydrolase